MRFEQAARFLQGWKKAGTLLAFAALTLVVLERDAQAYLDPGSMNFLVQSIVGAILGAAIYIKLQWKRVKATALRLFRSSREEEEG